MALKTERQLEGQHSTETKDIAEINVLQWGRFFGSQSRPTVARRMS